jgi:hypothetical protein
VPPPVLGHAENDRILREGKWPEAVRAYLACISFADAHGGPACQSAGAERVCAGHRCGDLVRQRLASRREEALAQIAAVAALDARAARRFRTRHQPARKGAPPGGEPARHLPDAGGAVRIAQQADSRARALCPFFKSGGRHKPL